MEHEIFDNLEEVYYDTIKHNIEKCNTRKSEIIEELDEMEKNPNLDKESTEYLLHKTNLLLEQLTLEMELTSEHLQRFNDRLNNRLKE